MARGRTRAELIGDKELRDKIHKLGEQVRQANTAAARSAEVPILAEANANAPGPHILALTSKKESNDNLSVVNIGPDAEHWYYQFAETGATPHEIKAGRSARREIWKPFGHYTRADKKKLQKVTGKSALAFEGKNGLVITKSVQHPGRKARPFLRPALRHNQDAAQKLAGQVFLAEIKKVCIDDND